MSVIIDGHLTAKMGIPFMTNHNRAIRLLPITLMLIVICCAYLPSQAQQPLQNPPAQQPPPFQIGPAPSLGEHIARFTIRARELVQVLQTSMLGLTRWIEYFAWLLALVSIHTSSVPCLT